MPARRRTELAYPAELKAEGDSSFVVTLPDFGVGTAQGDSLDQALGQAAALLRTMVATHMAEGSDLPVPSAPAGRPLVRLAPKA
jgi:antitoxin HicB